MFMFVIDYNFLSICMSKSNTYSLLDKKDKEKYPQKEEWIEMENLTIADFNGNNQTSQDSQIKYEKLKQEQISEDHYKKTQPINHNQQLPPQTQKKYPTYQQSTYPQNNINQNSQIKRPTNQSVYNNPYQNVRNKPVNSSNIQTNNQTNRNPNLNSRHPQQIRSQVPQNNKPNIPPMTVNCQKCTFSQSVPGNCQVYICCMCNQMNECFPLYGIFVCGVCHINVVYPFGTSQFVKCTRCGTINRVPFQPQKSYKSAINQKSRPTQQISTSSSEMKRNQYDEQKTTNLNANIKVQQKKQIPFQKKQNIVKTQTILKQQQHQVKPERKIQQKKIKLQSNGTTSKQNHNKDQKQERLLDDEDIIKTFKVQDDIFNETHHEKVKQEQILFDDQEFKIDNKNSKNSNSNQYPSFFD